MIYNRQKNIYYKEPKNKSLNFLYCNFLGRIILKIAILKPISVLGEIYMNSFFSKYKIKGFIKKNNIDMSDYPKIKYKSFNDFFIRRIKNNARLIAKDKAVLISPADSKLTVYKINNDTILNIKNSKYSINEIIKNDALALEYQNGYALIFRLSPTDYHHYCFIDDGIVLNNKKIKGVFHTVNPIVYDKYKVFSQNSREITLLDTKKFNKVVYIEVGALMVGKIKNIPCIKKFKKGDEKGYFCFGGSTIVLLFKENMIKLDKDILSNSQKGIETEVKLGEKIGDKNEI